MPGPRISRLMEMPSHIPKASKKCATLTDERRDRLSFPPNSLFHPMYQWKRCIFTLWAWGVVSPFRSAVHA